METDHAMSCVVGLLQIEAIPVALKHNLQVNRFSILRIPQSQFYFILFTAVFSFCFCFSSRMGRNENSALHSNNYKMEARKIDSVINNGY